MTSAKPPQNISHLLEPLEVSKILGVTVKSLAVWRCTKRYDLPYIKVGKSVKYRPEDIQAFIDSRKVA
jgi:hypothetical protein